MNVVVNISDARVSANAGDVLVTYSLGSCIGVSCYDPVRKVAGLLHFQLPTSTLDAARAKAQPLMFADTGFNWLLEEMTRLGAEKRRLKICLAGGAAMLNDNTLFDIGRRNHAAIRKALWAQGLFVEAEHVGGKSPRTMYLSVSDGSLVIKSNTETINV